MEIKIPFYTADEEKKILDAENKINNFKVIFEKFKTDSEDFKKLTFDNNQEYFDFYFSNQKLYNQVKWFLDWAELNQYSSDFKNWEFDDIQSALDQIKINNDICDTEERKANEWKKLIPDNWEDYFSMKNKNSKEYDDFKRKWIDFLKNTLDKNESLKSIEKMRSGVKKLILAVLITAWGYGLYKWWSYVNNNYFWDNNITKTKKNITIQDINTSRSWSEDWKVSDKLIVNNSDVNWTIIPKDWKNNNKSEVSSKTNNLDKKIKSDDFSELLKKDVFKKLFINVNKKFSLPDVPSSEAKLIKNRPKYWWNGDKVIYLYEKEFWKFDNNDDKIVFLKKIQKIIWVNEEHRNWTNFRNGSRDKLEFYTMWLFSDNFSDLFDKDGNVWKTKEELYDLAWWEEWCDLAWWKEKLLKWLRYYDNKNIKSSDFAWYQANKKIYNFVIKKKLIKKSVEVKTEEPVKVKAEEPVKVKAEEPVEVKTEKPVTKPAVQSADYLDNF